MMGLAQDRVCQRAGMSPGLPFNLGPKQVLNQTELPSALPCTAPPRTTKCTQRESQSPARGIRPSTTHPSSFSSPTLPAFLPGHLTHISGAYFVLQAAALASSSAPPDVPGLAPSGSCLRSFFTVTSPAIHLNSHTHACPHTHAHMHVQRSWLHECIVDKRRDK